MSTIQVGTDEVLLPGGERHNAHLLFPPVSLRIHEGDTLVWSSIGSVGEGLAVPSGTVEVLFERKDTPDRPTYSPELWMEYVPDYWIGKDVLVEYHDRDIHGPNTPTGSFSTRRQEDVGTFRGADSKVLQVSVHPKEHGHRPRNTGYPWARVAHLKLIEGQ